MNYWHQETKHHPASVDLELVKRLITTTKCSSLRQFLTKEFAGISKDYAGSFMDSQSAVPDDLARIQASLRSAS